MKKICVFFLTVASPLFACGLIGEYSNLGFAPTDISSVHPIYLQHHLVRDKTIVSAASFLDGAFTAGTKYFQSKTIHLSNVKLGTPLILGPGKDIEVNTKIEGGKIRISTDKAHFAASIDTEARPAHHLPLATAHTQVSIQELYAFMRESNLNYGRYFRTLKEVLVQDDQAIGLLEMNRSLPTEGHSLHPTIIDGAFHAMAAIGYQRVGFSGGDKRTLVPVFFDHVTYWGGDIDYSGLFTVEAHLKQLSPEDKKVKYDLIIFNAKGKRVFQIENGLLMQVDF